MPPPHCFKDRIAGQFGRQVAGQPAISAKEAGAGKARPDPALVAASDGAGRCRDVVAGQPAAEQPAQAVPVKA